MMGEIASHTEGPRELSGGSQPMNGRLEKGEWLEGHGGFAKKR